jgi:hypothetical protein
LKLEQYLDSKQLQYVDGLTHSAGKSDLGFPRPAPHSLLCPPLFTNGTGLKALFDLIVPIMNVTPQSMLIIDDLSVLEWMGIHYKEIHRFLRALLHILREVSCMHFSGQECCLNLEKEWCFNDHTHPHTIPGRTL